MTRHAVLIGNSDYKNLGALPCCLEDVAALRALVDATSKYDKVLELRDATSDDMRSAIRESVASDAQLSEIFFYFSGHGATIGEEFYYCGTDFLAGRPNETGLSDSLLHDLLRPVTPELVVKIIDACSSGILLVKDGRSPFQSPMKAGLRSLIQIASCLESQSSLSGEPLSEFTEAFCSAAIRKSSGPVYYSDIISTLRDDFLGNNAQTPHFVSQSTGRETLVDDAGLLELFSTRFTQDWSSLVGDGDKEDEIDDLADENQRLLARLEAAEKQIASREAIDSLTSALFDSLSSALKDKGLDQFFVISQTEHASFQESTTAAFIIRSLSNEKRQDEFVTARLSRERKKRNPYGLGTLSAFTALYTDDEWVENSTLELNISMKRAQLAILFTPRFSTLKQIKLVVTCAPSLDCCYIFELTTQHALIDFGSYSLEGDEITRKWYKKPWGQECEWLAGQIASRVKEAVGAQLEAVSQKLPKE